MIDENTPYKLAEIIRDTWPQLYHLKGRVKQPSAPVIPRVLNKKNVVENQ